MTQRSRHTPHQRIRIPDALWDAYGKVCERLETNRTGDLLDHMKARIRQYGTPEELAELAAAEQELSERRSRKRA